jgi:peroxiredoxin Q/BCP
MNTLPDIGSMAPDFTLPDQDGTKQTLSNYFGKGKTILLYFYPKDDTPGCTIEARSLETSLPDLHSVDTTVFGISTDSVASHRQFADKHSLTFTLLADEDKEVVSLYGVWGKKEFSGKEYEGTMRTSFLISPEGKILKIYKDVVPENHASEVLSDISALK